MRSYIDLRLRPNPEIAAHHLMSGLFGRLHLALVQLSRQDIGVSFPEHDDRLPTLGPVLRLHGSADSLGLLAATGWLLRSNDYVTVSKEAAVPAGCGHRVVSRVQAKSSIERMRRRAIRRHGYEKDEAAQRLPAATEQRLSLPFVTIGSRSTRQPSFRLFVRHGPVVQSAATGAFSAYGLSKVATVPWF